MSEMSLYENYMMIMSCLYGVVLVVCVLWLNKVGKRLQGVEQGMSDIRKKLDWMQNVSRAIFIDDYDYYGASEVDKQ